MKKISISIILLFAASIGFAQQKTVLLDSYFNNESMKDNSGNMVRFHYKWDENTMPGFSIFGKSFEKAGAKLETLYDAPTKTNLKNVDVFIIVDPDTKKEAAQPNFLQKNDIKAIKKWVKSGGVLFLMANDSSNNELYHFNKLAAEFGFHFNDDLISYVKDDAHFEDGAVLTNDTEIFKTAKKAFMKNACSISLKDGAYSVLKSKENKTILAANNYKKGYVVVVGDPWLYDEYVNGRLPKSFDNDKAADDIAQFLLSR